MNITVLIEDSVNPPFISEHGLCFLIEFSNNKILLDFGSSDAFINNGEKMNIDLSHLDIGVLSHGHYDHSGGLEAFFSLNSNATVYARPQVFNGFWSGNGGMHKIGVSEKLLDYFKRFTLILGLKEIADKVYLVPHNTMGLEKIGEKSKLYQCKCGGMIPDNFIHEQSLVLDTKDGLVIFNSCSHGGVATIIDEAKSYLNNKPVYAYIGGFHMKGTDNGKEICTFAPDELDNLCDKIIEEDIKYIYTGHCTGILGYNELKKRLGNRLHSLYPGLEFKL